MKTFTYVPVLLSLCMWIKDIQVVIIQTWDTHITGELIMTIFITYIAARILSVMIHCTPTYACTLIVGYACTHTNGHIHTFMCILTVHTHFKHYTHTLYTLPQTTHTHTHTCTYLSVTTYVVVALVIFTPSAD